MVYHRAKVRELVGALLRGDADAIRELARRIALGDLDAARAVLRAADAIGGGA